MMSSEIVTAVQEGIKLIIVLVDNHGFNSSVASRDRWGGRFRHAVPVSQETDRSGSTATRAGRSPAIDWRRMPPAWAPRPCGSTASTSCAGPWTTLGGRRGRPSFASKSIATREWPNYESWWTYGGRGGDRGVVNAARRE